PVRVERRRAEVLVLAARTPPPRDLQRVEVARVDLIEIGVARTPRVGAPVAPLAGLVPALERWPLPRARRAHRDQARGREQRAACTGNRDPASRHGFFLLADG